MPFELPESDQKPVNDGSGGSDASGEAKEPSGAPKASGNNFAEDPRFKDKTPEEIYEIHRNLETEYGRSEETRGKALKESEMAGQLLQKLILRDTSQTPVAEPEKPKELTEDEIQNYRDNPHIIRNEILGAVQEMMAQNTASNNQATNGVVVDNLLRNEFGARYSQVKPEIDEFLRKEPGVLTGRDPAYVASLIARYVRGGRNNQGLDNQENKTELKPPVHTEGVTTGAPTETATGKRGGAINAEEEEWLMKRGWTKEQIEGGRSRLKTNPLKRGFIGS